MKKILFAGVYGGGVENYMQAVLQTPLFTNGWEIHMLGKSAPPSRGWTVHEFKADFRPSELPHCIWALRRILRTHGIGLVHAHTARAGLLVALATLGTSVRFIYTPHTWRLALARRWWAKVGYWLIERFVATRAGAVTTLALQEQEFGIARGLCPSKKSHCVPTQIALPRVAGTGAAGLPLGRFVVGTCGLLEARKNPAEFLSIAERVSRTLPQALFVWIGGPGPADARSEAKFWTEASTRNLQNHVLLTGFLPHGEALEWLTQLDVYLCTSHLEGVPLTLLEAQLLGVPVVSTEYAPFGPAELIEPNRTGLTYPRHDAAAAAAALVQLHADPGLRTRLASDARRLALESRANVAQMARAFADLYENLLGGPSR